MHCPNDNTTLHMTTRDGIEIDYCPECRGVWLDRGELDKLIERSSRAGGSEYRRETDTDRRYDRDDNHSYDERRHHDDDDRHGSHHDSHHGQHKKKEGFLGDLFDF